MKPDGGYSTCLVAIQLFGMLLMTGCQPASVSDKTPKDETPTVRQPLRILVVDDPPLAEAIQREWNAQSQDPIQVNLTSVEEFQIDAAKQADLLIFPTSWLGMLAEQRAIRPLPKSVLQPNSSAAKDYHWNDILPLIRRQEIRWGDETYAVSFGSPQLLLFYRKDLFDKWKLSVPKTWSEYQQVIHQIEEQLQSDSTAKTVESATVEPLGKGWAARTLLARSAAYARHRSQYSTHFDFASMRPLINSPPFVRAFQELTAAYASMPESAIEQTPHDVVKSLLNNQAAMGLAWPSASREAAPQNVALRLGNLPGAIDVFQPSDGAWQQREAGIMQVPLLAVDGRLGAISRYGNNSEFSARFLLWLTDKQQSPRISTRGFHTTLFRESQLVNAKMWVDNQLAASASDYAEIVRTEQSRPQWLMMPRIPGQRQYIEALDTAIRQALTQQQKAQEVLDQVSSEWSNITNKLGLEKQRKAYLRDIGIE
ncbi:MAG: extracellular solute-binding protein [Pirellulaceae bacterium]|nr:extracellular solute-binding protein [Pirellulaceae bacterium]